MPVPAWIQKKWLELLDRPNDFTPGGLLRYGLTGLSSVYGHVLEFKRRRVRTVPRDAFRSRIVSIGNLTLGGTGKTPLVAWIANRLDRLGVSTGIVLRGYSRKHASRDPLIPGIDDVGPPAEDFFGDEAVLLSHLCPHAKIAVCPDRLAAVRRLEHETDCRLVLLDDGFQQVHLPKTWDIVCLDPLRPFGNGFLFPRGVLREPPAAISRATHVMFCKGTPRRRVHNRVRALMGDPGKPLFVCGVKITGSYLLDQPLEVAEPSSLRGGRYLILCSIANPASFVHSLSKIDLEGELCAYPDHFRFAEQDIRELETRMRKAKFDGVLTTEKDAVRLRDKGFGVPCHVMEMELEPPPEFVEQVDALAQSLSARVQA
jgi:tetraacyldisaccharide 4'-kinase